MLAPDDLVTLQDALRPPEGHHLDIAVGTTYSLDLLAYLAAPVAFAMFDLRAAADPRALDGLAVLEAVRRYADATTVFCQAGQIAVPGSYRPALTWTEGSVVPVRRPTETGVFHPKMWALRFVDDAGSFAHRVVVLSRNLTFDRSWDVVVALDEVTDNHAMPSPALGTFINGLCEQAVQPVAPERAARIRNLAATIARAPLSPPKPFHSAQVWPIGGKAGLGWPYPSDTDRVLIVSPFLTGSALKKITAGANSTLVSSPHAIDALMPADRDLFQSCYVLAAAGLAEALDSQEAGGDDTGAAATPPHATSDSQPPAALGLHAKLVISDLPGSPRSSRWVMGSANATYNAHYANTELAVVMEGPRAACGVEKILAGSGDDPDVTSFIDLLEAYTQGEVKQDDSDEQGDALDRVLTDVAVAGLTLTITPSSTADLYGFDVVLHAAWPSEVTMTCKPITLVHASLQRTVDPDTHTATWTERTLAAITPYVIVTASTLDESASRSRVLVADLHGAPSHRRERLLADMLRTAEDFLRYLLLLLGDAGSDDDAWSQAVSGLLDPNTPGATTTGWGGGLPVLESLLRAASHDPGSLRHVRGLVDDLRTAGVDHTVIPPEFDEIWAALDGAVRPGASR